LTLWLLKESPIPTTESRAAIGAFDACQFTNEVTGQRVRQDGVPFPLLCTSKEQLMSSHDLAGHVALVTGATSGIGAATAALLAERGAYVLVAGPDRSRGESVIAGRSGCLRASVASSAGAGYRDGAESS
jgi:hypothetical protein